MIVGPINVLLWRLVRGMVGAGAEPSEPWLRRVTRLLVLDHLDRLIRQILREVIPLFRRVRPFDRFYKS